MVIHAVWALLQEMISLVFVIRNVHINMWLILNCIFFSFLSATVSKSAVGPAHASSYPVDTGVRLLGNKATEG